jgi:hypothetical protein
MRLIFLILQIFAVSASLDLIDHEYEQAQAKLDFELQQIKNVRYYIAKFQIAELKSEPLSF